MAILSRPVGAAVACRSAVGVALAGAAAATLAGCQRNPQAIEVDGATPGVYSFVRAGDTTIAVLVLRFSGLLGEAEGEGDAVVDVRRGGNAIPLVATGGSACVRSDTPGASEPAAGGGCFAADLGEPLAPGERLELTVRFGDGTLARGKTTLPVPPTVLAPVRASVLDATAGDRAVLPVQVEAEGVRVLEAHTESESDDCEASLLAVPGGSATSGPGDGLRFSVTAVDVFGLLEVRCRRETAQPVPVRTRVFALDDAAADWIAILEARAVPRDRAAVGLEGAVGFFASASETSVRHAVATTEGVSRVP